MVTLQERAVVWASLSLVSSVESGVDVQELQAAGLYPKQYKVRQSKRRVKGEE